MLLKTFVKFFIIENSVFMFMNKSNSTGTGRRKICHSVREGEEKIFQSVKRGGVVISRVQKGENEGGTSQKNDALAPWIFLKMYGAIHLSSNW